MRFFVVCGVLVSVIAAFVLGTQFAPDTDAPTQTANVPTSLLSEEEPAPTPPPTAEERASYRVVRVVDGDTLAIEKDGESVTLRLIGLDTPETVDPRKPVQCFGNEASEKAKALLEGKRVSLESDTSQGEQDKYGRLLAYIFLEDGTLFNEYMIAGGYGHEYTYGSAYKYQDRFKAAEKAARENKRGLWADDACTTQSTRPAATKKSTTVPAPSAVGSYDCSKNIYNCSSFKTQTEAQTAFDACGGTANDIHKLDSDKDGSVCESLP